MNTYAEVLTGLKRKFVVVGLTGFTGSGCSSAAKILTRLMQPKLPTFENIFPDDEYPSSDSALRFWRDIERFQYDKLVREWKKLEREWTPFEIIEVSIVIFAIAMSNISPNSNDEIHQIIFKLKQSLSKKELEGLKLLVLKSGQGKDLDKSQKIISAYKKCKTLYPRFKSKIKCELGDFIELMQNYGDRIRLNGAINSSDTKPSNIFIIPEAIRRVIKAHRNIKEEARKESHFVIDAFRNPFEVEYFQRRYNECYVVAISRKKQYRLETLNNLSKIKGKCRDQKNKIEERENGKRYSRTRTNIAEWVTSQNVTECIQKAEIFIRNRQSTNKAYEHLHYNLIKLIALVKHPGCIPPSNDERNMQIAMVAKQMSGCISRQVGAVVVDKQGFILGVGWNDPPFGHIPCALRTRAETHNKSNANKFSDFEMNDNEFKNVLSQNSQQNEPFCFREELAICNNEPKQNEYTRALHAEENAFFQATKNSGRMQPGPTLYSTSVTCTLCAKKAHHIGIRKIVYIDNYSDLAIHQTVYSGPIVKKKENGAEKPKRQIEINKFEGIIGSAFFKLYSPFMPQKDWLNLY